MLTMRERELPQMISDAHALTLRPDPITGQLAALLARSGHTSRVGQLTGELCSAGTSAALAGLAVFHALCGNVESALKAAEQAIEARYPPFVAVLAPLLSATPQWPWLVNLMNLPR